jgi:hypothetical protein
MEQWTKSSRPLSLREQILVSTLDDGARMNGNRHHHGYQLYEVRRE